MSQRYASVSIPTPCQKSWNAMGPTGSGRHCASCQTEVIDFTRMSEPELIAYLTARKGKQLCGRMAVPAMMPYPTKWMAGPLRLLLAVAALFGWQTTPAAGLPPQVLPDKSASLKPTASQVVTIRGVVVDDLYNVPVAGAYVFVKNTKYGAVADTKGRFMLVLPADWPPLKKGLLTLLITDDPFSYLDKIVEVNLKKSPSTAPLNIRLLSQPERGIVMGKPVLSMPPISPSSLRKIQQ